uniref:Nucleotide sugar dehydrogenase n=1 Tax=uncultured Bacteroidota bacterium TaxID=152509 RepID=H5SG16_9BACT|nr:nucleotide sugar dehydrogenase [uncultured Bacteroidetes bacterium]
MTHRRSHWAQHLAKRIKQRTLTVGVLGLGYVGLPLAVEFARKGIRTLGFDTNAEKIALLERGQNYIRDLDDRVVAECVGSGMLQACSEPARLADCDVIFICVPTPFTPNKDPDISFILAAAESIAAVKRPGQLYILKSTTFPGTTRKYVQPKLEDSRFRCGREYFLAFSPERVDPGNKTWHTGNTPIVVGGITPVCTELACAATALAIEKVVPVSSPEVAEMEKLLENIFRSVNIALVNELAQLCDRIGINIWEVVQAAATKPFGFMPFYPGPGIGGHCILIDPYYLSWMAREYDFTTSFIELAAEVNEFMPYYVRNLIIEQIARQPIEIKRARVLLLGMAFKRDVDDLRHSPALKVAELLRDDGVGRVDYYDPYIPSVVLFEGSKRAESLQSLPALRPNVLRRYHVVCVTTDHSAVDYAMVARSSRVVVDTRNALRDVSDRRNIVLLGSGRSPLSS